MVHKAIFILTFFFLVTLSKARGNDSLIIAQSFINLSLTQSYFSQLENLRISGITTFIQKELAKIRDKTFSGNAQIIYLTSCSLLYLEKTKLNLRGKAKPSRGSLLNWKNTLDSAIYYFNKITIPEKKHDLYSNPFSEFINFNDSTIDNLESEIYLVKDQLAAYFNKNIYPDYKRIFYSFKHSGKYYLDSLQHFAKIFNLDFSFSILKPVVKSLPLKKKISYLYNYTDALDLVSQYLQLNFMAETRGTIDTFQLYKSYNEFVEKLKPDDSINFNKPDFEYIKKDVFFRTELNRVASDALFDRLQKKFPFRRVLVDSDSDGITDQSDRVEVTVKYFFPTHPPFPSCVASVLHFKPEIPVMKDMNSYLQKLLSSSGYDGRYQYYYYANSGFAITTWLERIHKNGAIDYANRWADADIGDQKFTLYNIFRTMFFATDANFRIIALVISPDQVVPRADRASFAQISELMKKSHSSLPKDIEGVSVADKAISILVYHFYQSDVGNVPQLDITRRLSVNDHLKGTALSKILSK